MKKVLFLLLLFIVACGGSAEDTAEEATTTTTVEDTTTTTVEDTTTSTIPPAPTSDINYIELYNSKLGTELCSDAKEIDKTTEECLRQYKENLNYLITLQNEIGDFASDLIAYYEIYPELINQEYEDYINFVENNYSQVFTIVSTVEAQYVERFGGVPTISLPIFSNPENLSVNCTVDGKFGYSENLKSAQLTYINNTGEIISFNTNDLQGFSKLLKNTGGTFSLFQSKVTNYLDESFEQNNNIENSFFVEHLFHRIVTINLPSEIGKGDIFQISMKIEPVVGSSVDSVRLTMIDPLSSTFANETTMTTKVFIDNTAIFYAHYLNEPQDYYKQQGTESSPSEVYFFSDIGYYKLGIIDINSLGSNRYNGYYYNSRDASNGLSMPLASRCGQLDQYQINPLDYDELILKIRK
jgi:hypothetical protein